MTTTLPVDRQGLEILSPEECLRLLASEPVGRLGFVSQGEPFILPVNHVVDGWTIVFRTTLGTKLDGIDNRQPVAFEVDGYDAEDRTGWSVLVRGTAEVVWSPAVEERLEGTGLQPWADDVARTWWIRIHPTTLTGRRIVHAAAEDAPAEDEPASSAGDAMGATP
jgi:uncharacterized protein